MIFNRLTHLRSISEFYKLPSDKKRIIHSFVSNLVRKDYMKLNDNNYLKMVLNSVANKLNVILPNIYIGLPESIYSESVNEIKNKAF
jgi:hypothetical protein